MFATLCSIGDTPGGYIRQATGLMLLAFTLTETAGLRHASATGVTAISAGSPIVTTLLVVVTRQVQVPPLQLFGWAMVLAAMFTIYAVGRTEELRAARRSSNARRGR